MTKPDDTLANLKIMFACGVLFLSMGSFAQESGCDFKIEKIGEGKHRTRVNNFDSLEMGETCFLSFMNTGKGKPDGELLVYDEMGRKRRSARYKGGIRVGTHYEWYKTGEIYDITNWETDTFFNSKSYYRSGKLKSTAVNGNRKNAVYTSYYENGHDKNSSTMYMEEKGYVKEVKH